MLPRDKFRVLLKTPVKLIKILNAMSQQIDACSDIRFIGHFDHLMNVSRWN